MSISGSGFEYNETKKIWVSRPGLCRRKDLGVEYIIPAQCPKKATVEGPEKEEGDDKDDDKGNDDEYEESDPSF